MRTQVIDALNDNNIDAATEIQRSIPAMDPERGESFKAIAEYKKRGNIQDVLDLLDELDGKTRKQIKATTEEALLVGHVIQQNPDKLQTTVVAKVAKALHEDRTERGVEHVTETVIKKKGVDASLPGDLKESLVYVKAFKDAGLVDITPAGKLQPYEFERMPRPPVKRPLNAPTEEFEVRRGIDNQHQPKAVHELTSVPFTIDEKILDEAEGNVTKYGDMVGCDVAREMIGQDIHFPYFGDSRVRVYTDTTCGFGPQGSDFGKAVIKNTPQEATSDLTRHFIYQANEYMDGNCPFEITADNLLLIPYTEAPKYKYRMLQLQNDYKEYLWTGVTSANSDRDARCSGSQILGGFGLYGNDIGQHLGMVPEEHELDWYERHALILTNLMTPELKERNISLFDEYDRIKRKIVKRPVMVAPYSGTLSSTIQEFFSFKEYKDGFAFNPSDVTEIAKLMQQALETGAGGTSLIMKWLQECIKIITKKGHKTVQWTRRDGVIASQTYTKKKEISISKKIPFTDQEIKAAQMQGRKKPKDGWRHNLQTQLRVPHLNADGEERTDISKHTNGISANFTHSADSTVAMKIIELLAERGIAPTRFVHDSISVHMNHTDALYECIIEAHIWLFSGDYLNEVRDEWEIMYDVQLPSTPERGDWDPEILRECPMFWS